MDIFNGLVAWIVTHGATFATNIAKALTLEIFVIIVAIIALYQYIKSTEKQQKSMLAASYKKRFQDIYIHLPSTIYDSSFDLEMLHPEEKEKTLRYMRSYFDLSSEMFVAFKRKKIERKDWIELRDSIGLTMSKPAFQDAWLKLNPSRGYQVKFASIVKKHIDKNNKRMKFEPITQSSTFDLDRDPI